VTVVVCFWKTSSAADSKQIPSKREVTMAASNNTNLSPENPSPADNQKKCCPTCSGELKSGMKYENVCTTCEPSYDRFCGGCQRKLWSCMCIKPHTWE